MKAKLSILAILFATLCAFAQFYGVGFRQMAQQPNAVAAGGGGGPANLLLSNLVSYWRLDEASGTRYDAHNTNDLTEFNTVTNATGVITNAADLEDDNNEWLQRTAAEADELCALGADQAFTAMIWINIESQPATGTGGLMGVGPGAVNGWCLAIRSTGTKLRFYITGQTTSTTHDINQPGSSAWYLIFAEHDPANNTIGIAVNDGAYDTTPWSDGTSDSSNPFGIGVWSGASATFDGLLDEAAFWKRTLTSAERSALYNSGSGLNYDDFEE